MVTVELATPSGQSLTVGANAGDRLLDLFDEAAAPMMFSCRAASCGVCRVDVPKGGEILSPPDADERETLDAFGGPDSQRLACQIRIRGTTGLVRLIAINEG
jgi:ferredoxin